MADIKTMHGYVTGVSSLENHLKDPTGDFITIADKTGVEYVCFLPEGRPRFQFRVSTEISFQLPLRPTSGLAWRRTLQVGINPKEVMAGNGNPYQDEPPFIPGIVKKIEVKTSGKKDRKVIHISPNFGPDF